MLYQILFIQNLKVIAYISYDNVLSIYNNCVLFRSTAPRKKRKRRPRQDVRISEDGFVSPIKMFKPPKPPDLPPNRHIPDTQPYPHIPHPPSPTCVSTITRLIIDG